MNRLKERVDRELSDAGMTPALEDRIVKGRVKRVKKKLTVALTAALVLLLAAGIAYATGLGKTIFMEMIEVLGGSGAKKYEAADELSSNEEISHRLYIAPDMTLTLKQSYYDGAQLILGYSFEGERPAVDFDYDPYDTVTKEIDLSSGSVEASALQGIKTPVNATDEDITVKMTDAERAAFLANYERDGCAGALIPSVDIVMIETADGEWLIGDATEVEGGVYEEITSLPDEALDRDSIQIAFWVSIDYTYIYMDETGSYLVGVDGLQQQEYVYFTIPRSTDGTREYAGSHADENYSATAAVYVTPVNVKSSVHAVLPEEWMPGWKEAEKLAANGYDVPVGYVLVVDGVVCEGEEVENGQSVYDFTRDWEYEYAIEIPEGAQVSLRPVYSISGEHSDEDIPLE